MLFHNIARFVLCVGLAAAFGLLGCSAVAQANEHDLLSRIAEALPAGWSVRISSFEGKCFVNITTAPMKTQASMYGSSYAKIDERKLTVGIQILPRYTPEMLKAIKDHNGPVLEKLKPLGNGKDYSEQRRELEQKLIDVPMFYDQHYGYVVSYLPRVPARAEDAQRLMSLLEHATSDWKSYDADKPKVLDSLRRILTH